MRRLMRERGLSIATAAIFVVTWIGAGITGWFEFAADASAHDEVPRMFGSDGYVWRFAEQTLQNWQSEFLAVALLVALASVLMHRGSQQSRDSREERRRRVMAISRRVDAIVGRREDH